MIGVSAKPAAHYIERIRAATCERELQRALEDELMDAGYGVRREVTCVLPMDGSGTGENVTRRVDLWFGVPQGQGFAQPFEDHRLGPGCAVAVELKFTPGARSWSDWRVAAEQAKGAMRAIDWHTSKGAVPRPQYVLVADNLSLLGKTDSALEEVDRSLWTNGCAVLRRSQNGGLQFTIHRARQDLYCDVTRGRAG